MEIQLVAIVVGSFGSEKLLQCFAGVKFQDFF